MADNKKYYYLKLKEGFFDSEDMKLLQGMKDGYIYSDILLKLYLQSLRQKGRLMYRDIIPYTPDMIATVTRHQVGTVEKAMDIFKTMGFIEILDNGAIYMMDIQNFIGQSSSEADRIRNYRNSINAEKSMVSSDKCVTNEITDGVTKPVQMYNGCTPDIKDKEIKDKENKKNNIIARSPVHQDSGPEADVAALILNDRTEWRPTQALFAEYVRLYPNVDVKQQFNEMRGWCISNPAKCKTRRGIKRFVNGWLAREQDGWGAAGNRGDTKSGPKGAGSLNDSQRQRISELVEESARREEDGGIGLSEVMY